MIFRIAVGGIFPWNQKKINPLFGLLFFSHKMGEREEKEFGPLCYKAGSSRGWMLTRSQKSDHNYMERGTCGLSIASPYPMLALSGRFLDPQANTDASGEAWTMEFL